MRFWRDVFPRFAPGIAALMLFLGLRPAFAVLLGQLLGSHAAMWLWRGALSSVCARPCVSVGGVCLGSRLLFAAWRQTGRLAISCVSIPPGRDRHSCVLAVLARLSALAGSLRVWPFLAGDPDELPGTRRAENGKRDGGAALMPFAQSYWPCNAFRGEYAGAKCGSRTAAAPNLRQRVECGSDTAASLDSLHAVAGGVLSTQRLPSVYARRCGSIAAICPPFTPAVCPATNRTACDSLRSYSAGSRSPFVRSRGVGAVICLGWFTLGLCVSLWRSRRGYRGRGERGTEDGVGGAAFVRFCAIALALQFFPRGVRWG